MLKKIPLLFILVFIIICSSTSLSAQYNPIQFSLTNEIQVIPESEPISALRLAIYGKNTSTKYVDIGIVTQNTRGESTGVQWSLVGLQDSFTGWQVGTFYNYSQNNVKGLMTGLVNRSGNFFGVQVGIVNISGTAGGVQVGILNFIKKGGMLPFFPFFNLAI